MIEVVLITFVGSGCVHTAAQTIHWHRVSSQLAPFGPGVFGDFARHRRGPSYVQFSSGIV